MRPEGIGRCGVARLSLSGCTVAFKKQTRQNEWPQVVVTGSNNTSRHTGHPFVVVLWDASTSSSAAAIDGWVHRVSSGPGRDGCGAAVTGNGCGAAAGDDERGAAAAGGGFAAATGDGCCAAASAASAGEEEDETGTGKTDAEGGGACKRRRFASAASMSSCKSWLRLAKIRLWAGVHVASLASSRRVRS